MSTDTETLSRALAGIPDEFAPTPEDKRNAWSASSFTLVSMLRGLGDAAPNRYTYTFDYGDGEDFEISVSRVRVVSQLAALMEAESALATMTRERDEARQYIPAAQSCHRLADYMSTNRDLLEYDGCDMAGDGAIDVLGRLARERDELRAALLNERGEGEPPSEGWAPVDATPGRWEHHARGWCCYRIKTREYIVVERGSLSGELAREKTAREAMRAVDTALAGSKS